MKKIITLLLTLLVALTLAVGCSQNEKNSETTFNVNTDNSVGKTKESKDVSTELFGIPQRTDDYFIEDLSDPTNPDTAYVLEEQMGDVFGIEGYTVLGAGEPGSSFYIYAKNGKGLIIKSIDYENENYTIVLQEVEQGTPLSYDKLSIVSQKPFKTQVVKYEDGTKLRDIDELASEVGLGKYEGSYIGLTEGKQVIIVPDLDSSQYEVIEGGKKVRILSNSATMATDIYDVASTDIYEQLKEMQVNDYVEYMYGQENNTIYSIRIAEKNK